GGQQITTAIRRLRHSLVDERREVNMEDRVANQLGWYAGKSTANGRAAGRWFWLGLVLETAALGFAIFQNTAEGIPDLVGLLAAVAIAATALTRLDRHDELSKSYGLAAYELTRIRLSV
ncbi:MAG TPA: SLATT domain-containing protein, partial [Thermomicrobiales bacterium]|nr:SLATT domain-containing protein [Thermomicrobiales bacterium]